MIERREKITLQLRLEESIGLGDLDAVMDSVHRGAQINLRVGSQSPLCIAIRHNHIDIFTHLLHRGANISFLDSDDTEELEPYMDTVHAYNLMVADSVAIWPKWTLKGVFLQGVCFAIAELLGKSIISRAISAHKANEPLHSVVNDGTEVLKLLCTENLEVATIDPREDYMALLLDHGIFSHLETELSGTRKAPIRTAIQQVFSYSIKNGYRRVVQRLLDTNVDVDMALDRIKPHTALHYASSRLDVPMVDLLLERGARTDCTPTLEASLGEQLYDTPSTALMATVDSKSTTVLGIDRCIETLGRLIAGGADVNARDSAGATALARALRGSHARIIQFLLSAGADPNIADNTGQIPLHLPIYRSPVDEIVSLLIPLTHDINHRDHEGNTPLINLVRNNSNLGAVRILLDAGAAAQINTISSKGTALQNSTWWVTEEMMGALLEAGADPNIVKGSNPSPLMGVASVTVHAPELISFLLRHGADPRYADADGKTALHVVIERRAQNALESVKLLVEHGADVNALWNAQVFGKEATVTPLALELKEEFTMYRRNEIAKFLLEQGATTDGIPEERLIGLV